jgi:hypothetical protein
MTSYFYVSRIGGGKPSFKHTSFDEAVREAQRLIDTIGGEYEILEARAVVKAAPKYVVRNFRRIEFPTIMDAPYSHDDETCPF